MKSPPVLLLAFNRPDLTRRALSVLRTVKTDRIFYAVDGPRSGRPDDESLVAACRELVEEIDWPCEIETLFPDENLGCRRAVRDAISWFFEHVEEGIILEDDCLPHPSFFAFCARTLEMYRHDARIGMVSGNNFKPQHQWADSGHEFTIFPFIWGWATWRRSWKLYDSELTDWPELRDTHWLRNLFNYQNAQVSEAATRFWKQKFDQAHQCEIDTWDYSLVYSFFKEGLYSVIPACNLTSNVGFGDNATHTKNSNDKHARLPTMEIKSPGLPGNPSRDHETEIYFLKQTHGVRVPSARKRLKAAFSGYLQRFFPS